jgi:hypothetical protein
MVYFVDVIGYVDVEIRQSLFPHREEEGLEFAADALTCLVWDPDVLAWAPRYKAPNRPVFCR